jgi:hypothetical protein
LKGPIKIYRTRGGVGLIMYEKLADKEESSENETPHDQHAAHVLIDTSMNEY